eukprot:gene26021-biopygen13037
MPIPREARDRQLRFQLDPAPSDLEATHRDTSRPRVQNLKNGPVQAGSRWVAMGPVPVPAMYNEIDDYIDFHHSLTLFRKYTPFKNMNYYSSVFKYTSRQSLPYILH